MKKIINKSAIVLPVKNYLNKNPHVGFVWPAIFIMLLLSIVPTIFLLGISVTNYQLGWDFSSMKFVGFGNFIRLFSGRDPDFWFSVFISLSFMVIASAIEILLGFILALILDSVEFKIKPIVLGILIIPLAMTPTIAALMWKLMLNAEYGIINHYLLKLFNFKVTWLGQEMALISILLVDIWQYTPFVVLIVYSGLRSLPRDPFESALIDGANYMQIIINLTIPMLKKLLYLVLLFRMIDALRIFDTVYILTQGGPGRATELLSLHIFRLANAKNGFIGRAAAVSLVLIFLITIISKPLIARQRKEN